MLQLQYAVTVEQFNRGKYLKRVDEALRETFLKAGRIFLLTAIPKVPIWTGMARGAFRNAEDVFGKVSTDKTSGYRIRGGRGGGNQNDEFRRGYTYEGRERFPNRGRDYSTPPGEIIESASIARGKTQYVMKYTIDIKYFTYLDQEKWHAIEEGEAAAFNYLVRELNLPDPTSGEFITTRKFLIG